MRNKNARVSDPNLFVTNSGDRYHIIYSPVINEDGTISLIESGKDDIQAMIDSNRELCDMSFIMNRLQMGDTSVLNSGTPMYGDFTDLPRSQAEVLQTVMDAEASFYKLPLDVRNKFNNDFRQWFAQAGTSDWFENMKAVYDPVVNESSVDEVIVDES